MIITKSRQDRINITDRKVKVDRRRCIQIHCEASRSETNSKVLSRKIKLVLLIFLEVDLDFMVMQMMKYM